MKRFLCLFLAAAAALVSARAAELRLAHVFSDHMVMQRETSAPVWGWGEPGATVTVETSWNGEKASCRVGSDGRWRLNVETGPAGGPYRMEVRSGKETLLLEDILLGEVWICTGQSNMEMPVRGFGFQQVDGALGAILRAGSLRNRVRLLDIKTPKCATPIDDIEATWEVGGAAACAKASAVGWFFAENLQASLGVPVGIIVNAWGGSRIEPWMTMESIENSGITQEDLKEILAIEEIPEHWPETPEKVWNGRMAPIAGYAARGFLWYQGCSNIGQGCYDRLQTAMVRLWRDSWGRGDMPFLYVLLAPYPHGDSNGTWRPLFVETQMKALETIPSAWAVSTETYGDEITIHPSRKKEVADMLAMKSLQSVYGIDPGIPVDYPTPSSVDFGDDGRVTVRFHNVWSNLMAITARDIVGFELAGIDHVFHPAAAEVDWDGQTVFVRCDAVPVPIALRYGFRNYMGANLQTSYGIPVPPFRTDDW